MAAATYLTLVTAFGALCGALVARIISAEAENSRVAFFMGIYTGAGGGLVGGPPFAFLLTLVTGSWSYENGLAIVAAAIEATGTALLYGAIGGAAGGAVVGLLYALLKLRT
jgi:hypothetical protein